MDVVILEWLSFLYLMMMPAHGFVRSRRLLLRYTIQLGLVADPVIEAIAKLEFEDGLRTGVIHGGLLVPFGRLHLS